MNNNNYNTYFRVLWNKEQHTYKENKTFTHTHT